MPFPQKKYERLQCLQRKWQVSHEDIYYAIENGLLKTCIWLPLRWVERGAMKNRRFVFEQHEHVEGFVGVRPEDCRNIFSIGSAKLRVFHSVTPEGYILRLAYEPPQPEIAVRINDLVVLQHDREQFEETYNMSAVEAPKCKENEQSIFHVTEDYRHVMLEGEEYHLGDVQARVVRHLHDAAQSRNPWMHGKTLIHESGSQALRVRDIFKNKPNWRKLVLSDDRGYYRLNLPAYDFQNQPSNSIVEGQQHPNTKAKAV